MSTSRILGSLFAVLVAAGAQAQTGGGSDSMTTRPESSTSSTAPGQAVRSMPSRPSGPSGPSLPGTDVTPPDSSGPGTSADGRSIGGSGSAGVSAMGGGMSAGSSATREMGSGAMTDCPMGTSRKMGLCVPYGQERKNRP